MKLAYFVHDLADPAVHRRLRMLRPHFPGGIVLLGFRRTPEAPATVEGVPALDLGRTEALRLGKRVGSVLKAAAALGRHRAALAGADIIMARQLETLALAGLARRRFAPRAKLVFECLDIHRMMLKPGRAGAALRGLEGRLLRGSALLVTSSPAFVREYFEKVHAALPPVLLLENKVLPGEVQPAMLERLRAGTRPTPRPAGPPWRIGWFGVLRCQRSLDMLAALCRQFPGQVEVILRGRPNYGLVPEIDRIAAETPGMSLLGPYDRATELPAIYGDVHFSWAMDFYERGQNSDWLLPNRLYEGGLYGTVPIALDSVETGRWLAARQLGVLLSEPVEQTLPAWFAQLDARQYREARAAMDAVPVDEYLETDEGAFAAKLRAL